MSGFLIAILFFILIVSLAIFVFLFLRYRKKIEELSTHKNNFETICRESNDAMLVVDIVDGRIHKANPALAGLLGYSIEKLEHVSFFDLHPRNMLDKSSVIIADVWENGGLVYQDIPFVKEDGDLLNVECSAKVIRYAGRPSVLIYARDITERLRMEKEIRVQKELIEEKNKNITDSIRYAKRIQDSFLPTTNCMRESLGDYFVLFKPKDIVSGDFYWIATPPLPEEDTIHFSADSQERSQYLPLKSSRMAGTLFACCDCTGHGVPGAFVSILGYNGLNRCVKEFGLSQPASILDKLNEIVLEFFSQQGKTDIKDGLDIALCAIDREKMTLEYSGANNSIYLFRNGALSEFKADKQPIGEYFGSKNFTNNSVQIQKGDTVYLFSDGYADQFGGPKGKKFKYSQFEKLLVSIQNKAMNEQREILNKTIETWKGNLEQVDDICIIGVKI